jgi:hypothetical protein
MKKENGLLIDLKTSNDVFLCQHFNSDDTIPTRTLKPYKPCPLSSTGLINSCPFMLQNERLGKKVLCGPQQNEREREREDSERNIKRERVRHLLLVTD